MPLDGEYGGVDRAAAAVDRMALPSRHHARPAGRRRHRPHPFDLCHGAGDRTQGHPGLPLHDRGVRRQRHPLRGLCDATARRNCRILRSQALEGRNGCLLANHGMIATGANLDKAHVARGRARDDRHASITSRSRSAAPCHSQRGGDRGHGAWISRPTASSLKNQSRPQRRALRRSQRAADREEAQQEAMTRRRRARGAITGSSTSR